MRTDIVAAVAVVAIVNAPLAAAEIEVGLKAGTLGIGLGATYPLSDRWGLRGGFNQFQYEFEDDIDDVTFDGDLDLSSITLLADFRPGGGGPRLRLERFGAYGDQFRSRRAGPG